MKKANISSKITIVSLLISLLFCAGCGEQKIDTSNDKAYSDSMKKIYEAVSENEREDFRENFSAIMSEIPGFGSSTLNERDMMQLYSITNLLGGDEGTKMLQAVNGLTGRDINKKGRTIRKANLEKRLSEARTVLAKVEEEMVNSKQLILEQQKVEVVCSDVQLQEGFNFEKKPWGTIHTITAPITITNNSSAPVELIRGKVVFADDVDGTINSRSLTALKEVGTGKTMGSTASEKGWEVAPGTVGKGQLVLEFSSPNKKHPFPATKKYTAKLSDVQVSLKSEIKLDEFSLEFREGQFKNINESIAKMEQELLTLK